MFQNLSRLASGLTILSLLASCASFRSNKFPEITAQEFKFPSDSSAKKVKIFTKWDFNSSMPVADRNYVIFVHKQMLHNNINESGCCTLTENEKEADVVINGSFRNESSSGALIFSVITGASLYIIPLWIDSKIRIVANVQSKKAGRNYDLQDSLIFAQWLPFIVAMPFRGNPLKEETKMIENLYKNLIV